MYIIKERVVEVMEKYGKKLKKNKVHKREIGTFYCPVCGKVSRLIKQTGKGFEMLLSVCPDNHLYQVDKKCVEKYHKGDRIRLYDVTCGEKNSRIKLDTYYEGVIIRSYPDQVDYKFDFIIDKNVINGIETEDAAVFQGAEYKRVSHVSDRVMLLSKAAEDEEEKVYVQEILKFT